MRGASGSWKAVVHVLARALSMTAKPPDGVHDAEPRIMALVPEGPNRLALEAIFEDAGWALTLSDTGPHSIACKDSGAPLIIIYDRELSPQHWRDIIQDLARKTPRPYIILLSANADTNLWDELQRAGGSDILRAPINRDQLIEALAKGRQLWSARQHLGPPAAPLTR
jgi:FixJ family two-component response regulator